jgi:chromosome segregation ATPase
MMMPRMKAAKMTLVIAGAAGLLASGGCDDSHSADKRVLQAVQSARVERMKGGMDNLEKAQTDLQKAQQEAAAASSTATKTYAAAMLAHAELDNAIARISDPEKGVDPGHRKVQQLLAEINQLAEQIRASNNMAMAYANLEPSQARTKVQDAIKSASGEQDATWIAGGGNKMAVPSLSAVKNDVQKWQAEVQKQQEHIDTLQKQQQQLAQQADQAMSKAEGAKGASGVEQFRQASNLRKQAEDLANQLEVAKAKIIPAQQDLKLAQAREQAISAAIEQFQKLGQQLDSGWKSISDQVSKQQALSASILNGGEEKSGQESIKQLASELAKQQAATKQVFDAAESNLENSIKHFQAAGSAASQLASEIQSQLQNLTRDNQMYKALETLRAVYNPATFKLGQANAQLALANLQTTRAQILVQEHAVEQKLAAVLKDANLEMPQKLPDANKLAGEIQSVAKASAQNYKEATDLFATVGSGTESDKNGGRAGQVYALYGQALLARATGNAAAAGQQLAAARSARDQIMADNPAALVALPSELVPAPTTAPSTAPSPAGAAAPRTPTPGAATPGAPTPGAATPGAATPAAPGTAAPGAAAPAQ